MCIEFDDLVNLIKVNEKEMSNKNHTNIQSKTPDLFKLFALFILFDVVYFLEIVCFVSRKDECYFFCAKHFARDNQQLFSCGRHQS